MICRMHTINVSVQSIRSVPYLNRQGKSFEMQRSKILEMQSWEKIPIAGCLEISFWTLPKAERSTTTFISNWWTTGARGGQGRAQVNIIFSESSYGTTMSKSRTGHMLGQDPLELQSEDHPLNDPQTTEGKGRDTISLQTRAMLVLNILSHTGDATESWKTGEFRTLSRCWQKPNSNWFKQKIKVYISLPNWWVRLQVWLDSSIQPISSGICPPFLGCFPVFHLPSRVLFPERGKITKSNTLSYSFKNCN